MPELSVLHFAILAILFGVGAVIGWLLRADRCAREKIAINAGWQEQFESQQAESRRLAEQNRGLMEQINEHNASEKDHHRRAQEIAAALKESTARRDELMRHNKDLRSELDIAIKQRNDLRTEIRSREVKTESSANALREKDNKIFKLSRELTSWQNRVPPLVEKYRQRELEMKELQYELEVAHQRNREIDELQNDLARARDRIAELENMQPPEQRGADDGGSETRIEPLHSDTLPGLDASNEQYVEATADDEPKLASDDWSRPQQGNGGCDEALSQDHADDPDAARVSKPGRVLPLRDDLQRIKGVGPAIERTLNDLGIYRFDQIASISEYDIDRIAGTLRGFRSRIYREDWIGQARTLYYRKLGAYPFKSDPS